MRIENRLISRFGWASVLVAFGSFSLAFGGAQGPVAGDDQRTKATENTTRRATNTYVIDGTTYSKFGDLPPLVDGDRIEIDPAHIIYEGEVLLRNLDGLTITRKAGTTGYGVKRNAKVVAMTTQTDTGAFDVWQSDPGGMPIRPETLWEEWDNPLNVDANGFHTAFVHENLMGLSDLKNTRSWWWEMSTKTLYVSVPSGIDASSQQYLAGIAGHGLVFQSITNSVVEHISFEITTQAGASLGYGFRETFSSAWNVVKDCRFRANQYHNLGSVSNVCNFVSMNNDIGESVAGNDSQLVFYSRLGSTQDAKSINDTFHIVPWLDVDGNPHRRDKITSIASHRGKNAFETAVGGIQIINPTCISYGYETSGRDVFLTLGASDSGHVPPVIEDELDPTKYPIIVIGGHINVAIPAVVGGNSNTQNAAAFVRTRFDVDARQLLTTTSGSGCFTSQCGDSSAFTKSTLALFACTISATMPIDVTSQTIFASKTNGARLILDNCSIHLVGQYPVQQRLFSFSPTAGLAWVHGCIIDVEDPNTRMLVGNADSFREDPTRFSFKSNMYSEILHHNFWAGQSSITRALFRDTYDIDGEYDFDPEFLDNSTLEPDLATRGFVNSTKPLGPVGINNLAYDETYGAWQYSSGSTCPADINDDGQLNFFDVSLFLQAFGAQDPIADFTNDGAFDFFDVSAFLGAFATGCP